MYDKHEIVASLRDVLLSQLSRDEAGIWISQSLSTNRSFPKFRAREVGSSSESKLVNVAINGLILV